ncbi:MAG TPA: hypothetical protein PKH29_12335, partial [Oscillospiraceae bacterium]|nr:hypothetical protein [Oscillospiraceae bacterium]
MSRTFKKLSAMVLAMLMVVTMASALAVSAELKYGARTLGNAESQTLGTSANYAKIMNNTRSTTDGSFFADSIGLWGWNGITSAAPLSNQNGIDIFVEVVRGTYDSRVWSEPVPESWTWTDYRTTPSTTATVYTAPAGWVTGGPTTQNLNVLDGIDYPNAVTYHPAVAAQVISGSEFTPSVYTKKNIYIDLSAWSNPTSSAKWAKYGTNTITIGFNASANAARVLSWSKMPATGVDSNNLLQFFTFQVDATPAQIQLFDTDLAAAITATTGDNGVFNVYFQECTKTTFTESTPATPTVYTDDAITAGSFTTAVGYVYNMDGEVALWNDMFHGTHAYTKLFGFEYGVAGLIGYNTKDTTAAVDFMLTAGSLVTYQWDITSASYKDTTTSPATLDLSLLKKSFTAAAGTYAYNYASWLAFVTMRNDAAGYGFTVTMADPRIGTSTLVPSDATVTYTFTGLKGNLRLTWATANAVSGLQTATAVGGEHGGEGGWHGDYRIVGNQSQTLLASELEAGKLLYWEQVPYESGNQPFGTTIQWPTNQNAYLKITYKTGRGTQSDWNFDTKIRALASDMNLVDAAKPGNVDLQLVPTIGGADLIAGLKETDAKGKTLRDFGHTLNYYVEYTNDFMAQMVIDIHDNTLDNLTTAYGKANLVVSIAKGTIVTAYSCPITQYDETFVIPLQDGTFTLMRIKVRTNFDDKVSPLADADITDFNYSRLTFVEQIKLYNDRLVDANGTRVYNSNANKVIYVDMINGIPGSGSYWDYNTATPPVGTFRADGYNGVNYYTKLTALLSYVGFNTDGSKPVRNPVGYAKFYNTID